MAFPVVASVTESAVSSANTTTKAVDLPSGIANGDLVLVILTKDGGGLGSEITSPGSGWTKLYQSAPGGANPGMAQTVWYRFCDGSESSTTLTVTFDIPDSQQSTWFVYRITGAQAVEAGAPATSTSTAPDPPSLSPSWGSADTLWMAVDGWDGFSTQAAHSSYPTSYADNQQTSSATGSAAGAGASVATRNLTASSDDPDAFAISSSKVWVANTIAIQPTAGGLNITATGIASTLAIGSPTITTGDVTVSPTGIASALAIGEPTVTAGAVTVSPTGIASTLAIGEPTVTIGAATVSPTGIPSAIVVGQPTITVGDVTVSPTGIASTFAVGQPTITSGVTVEPTGIPSALSVGEPTITVGDVTVSATGISSTLAIGEPTVSAGAVTVSATGIASTLAIGEPTVSGDAAPSTTFVSWVDDFGEEVWDDFEEIILFESSELEIVATGIPSALAIGQPTITLGALTITATGIASTLALGQPTVTVGDVTVSPTGIPSALAVGEPTVTTGAVTVSPTGIASTLTVGQPTITTGTLVQATGIASTLAIGEPTVSAGAVTISVIGIPSTLDVGEPTVVDAGSTQNITVIGIASTLDIGEPTISIIRRADSSWQAARHRTSIVVRRWGGYRGMSNQLKLWQGDRHLLRLNIDEVDNGVSTGDLNLSNVVSFSYSIGTPSGAILVNRTYTKAEVLDGVDASGNVLIPIVGGDTETITPGFYTFQVWMVDTDGYEYTVFERELALRDKMKD